MPNIKASFLSLLVDIIGKEEINLSIIENSTIKDVLVKLRLSIGKNFENSIFNVKDKLNKYIILGLNGKDIRKFNGLDTIIKDGDELSFLPAIAGG
ncbi:MAG: MoaD/ThiS family protein [Candidatus Lokiarchaeia archaeon]|nr:MoaD/ThiS family protein [Candidatus Lokiarchaeia archaeon]